MTHKRKGPKTQRPPQRRRGCCCLQPAAAASAVCRLAAPAAAPASAACCCLQPVLHPNQPHATQAQRSIDTEAHPYGHLDHRQTNQMTQDTEANKNTFLTPGTLRPPSPPLALPLLQDLTQKILVRLGIALSSGSQNYHEARRRPAQCVTRFSAHTSHASIDQWRQQQISGTEWR